MTVTSIPFSPQSLLRRLGVRAKARRLDCIMSRRELSARSGVPESTIKRFESVGEIGTASLIMLLVALDLTYQVELLCASPPRRSIDDILRPVRKRGARIDSGKRRTRGTNL